MGGQACVLYGALEFSSDLDLALLANGENQDRLGAALAELQAERIAVPPFAEEYLLRGHSVHFRCMAPGLDRLRIDVMAVMRGVDPFPALWERRTTYVAPDGGHYEMLSLPDLVKAKKTQRDKDWPMIRRLLERSYFEAREHATAEEIAFWLRELRSPELLIDLAQKEPDAAEELIAERPLLASASFGDKSALTFLIQDEEREERERDRLYWEPLKRELEALRRAQRLKGEVSNG